MDFDFIGEDKFRASLISDYKEMKGFEEAQSWKAVQVLAGSIVEALLIEFIVTSGTATGNKDPLKLHLSEAIQICSDAGAIRPSTTSLCDVIQDYRNLIHPGRLIRLSHEISPEGARIASNIVTLVAKEIALKRKETFGLNAEQITKKLRTDQHSLALLPQLLSETNEHERLKLVELLLPKSYLEESADFLGNEATSIRIKAAYRAALNSLPEDKKVSTAERFAKMVREEAGESLQNYGDAFFSVKDIVHLKSRDAELVLKYFITRLENTIFTKSDPFFDNFMAIGPMVRAGDREAFANTLVRWLLKQPSGVTEAALTLLEIVFELSPEEQQTIMQERVEDWRKKSEERCYGEVVNQKLDRLLIKWLVIPF